MVFTNQIHAESEGCETCKVVSVMTNIGLRSVLIDEGTGGWDGSTDNWQVGWETAWHTSRSSLLNILKSWMAWCDFRVRIPVFYIQKSKRGNFSRYFCCKKQQISSYKNSEVYIKDKDHIIILRKLQKSFFTWCCCNKCQIIDVISTRVLTLTIEL